MYTFQSFNICRLKVSDIIHTYVPFGRGRYYTRMMLIFLLLLIVFGDIWYKTNSIEAS